MLIQPPTRENPHFPIAGSTTVAPQDTVYSLVRHLWTPRHSAMLPTDVRTRNIGHFCPKRANAARFRGAMMITRKYRLVGTDGQVTWSTTPGLVGGNRQSRIYGRLDCPSARRALDRGGYVAMRVFFVDEATALSAGFRPCAVCMSDAYRRWKEAIAAPMGPVPTTRAITSEQEVLDTIQLRDGQPSIENEAKSRSRLEPTAVPLGQSTH